MSVVTLAVLLVAVFAVCQWGGRTLARHHGDGREVAAVAALGAAVLGALWAVQALHGDLGSLPTLGLVGAGAGGLFAGYTPEEPAA